MSCSVGTDCDTDLVVGCSVFIYSLLFSTMLLSCPPTDRANALWPLRNER